MTLQPYSKWVQLYETMLNKYGKQFLFKSNLNSQDIEKLEIKSRFKNIYICFMVSCLFQSLFSLRLAGEKGIVFIEQIYGL